MAAKKKTGKKKKAKKKTARPKFRHGVKK